MQPLSENWESWPQEAKEAFLATLRAKRSTRADAQPPTAELPALHPSQREVVAASRRFNVLACGRRWGKTTLGLDRIIRPAMNSLPVAWFSPTYKMLTDVWREARRALFSLTERVNAQEHRIELHTGGVLDMWSLDQPDAARGRKYARVVIDEAAMVSHLQDAWQAVIRPTLTDYEGDAWFLSTPKGMNFFQTMYNFGQDPNRKEWVSWRRPTVDNPFINAEEVEKAREELPEMVFNQEYLAEFIRNEGAVFRNILANLTAPKDARPEDHRGHTLVAGVDWAQKHDFTCISIGCATCKQEVELDRFNKIEWAFQRGRLKLLCDRWKVSDVLPEENSIGGPNIEALRTDGVPITRVFTTSASTKPPLIQSLALSLEKEEFRFLDIPVATAELEAYESKVNANTGRISYSAPEGMNDDTVIARALMRWAVEHQPKPLIVRSYSAVGVK